MMDKDKLRKADIFSGAIILLFGLWIISQALKMPMKDSWGGVQNVWFVSPALFPLLVGAVLSIMGALLIRTAVKTVGFKGAEQTLRWICSPELIRFLKVPAVIRFYVIVVLLFSYVFVDIPRIDFFLCSVLFLAAFISMFYFDDDTLIKKMFFFYLAGTALMIIYFTTGFSAVLVPVLAYPNDWLTLVFITAYLFYSWTLIRHNPQLRRKYRMTVILAVVAPFFVGSIFKYLLLVPMPAEGLVVEALDAIWYFEF